MLSPTPARLALTSALCSAVATMLIQRGCAAAGRLFRVAAVDKVGAPVAVAINNLSPFISTGLAILFLGERVTPRTTFCGGTPQGRSTSE